MKDKALSVRLCMNGWLILILHVFLSYPQNAVHLQVDPNRLQFFEYESIVLSCRGLDGQTGWRVRRMLKGFNTICASSWDMSTGPCTIKNAFGADSGEYWCEARGGTRSSAVNITITSGSVILESPVHPVTDGDNVTLSCRQKQTSSHVPAEFYKDATFIGSSSTGEITLVGVTASDEGLYRCRISGAGESLESRVTVRGILTDSPNLTSPGHPVMTDDIMIVRCRKRSSFSLTAGYRDDLHVNTSSLGEMIIRSVSKSEEGLYKCSISGAGESAESWVTVRAVDKDDQLIYNYFLWGFVVFRTVGTILLVALGLVVGRLHFRKLTVTSSVTMFPSHEQVAEDTCLM